MFVRFIHVDACSCISSFLLLYGISLYDYITSYLSFLLPVDIWAIVSIFAVVSNVSVGIFELVPGRLL